MLTVLTWGKLLTLIILHKLTQSMYTFKITGLSSLGVPGVPWHTQVLADRLTLFQPGGQIMPT